MFFRTLKKMKSNLKMVIDMYLQIQQHKFKLSEIAYWTPFRKEVGKVVSKFKYMVCRYVFGG